MSSFRTLGVSLLLLGGVAGCEDPARPPDYGVYQAVILAGEVTGRMNWGPSTGQGDLKGQALWLRTLLVGPDLKPSFMDSAVPPYCFAFTWTAAEQAPAINAADGGDLTISGYAPVQWYAWGKLSMTPPKMQDLPKTIACKRGPHPTKSGFSVYGCSPDPATGMAGISGSWLNDSVRIAASGGTNIGAFTEASLHAPAAAQPEQSFDLNQIDPQRVTASWRPLDSPANMAVIELVAQLVDGATMQPSQFAQVLCLQPAPSTSREIPAGALDLLPGPTGTQMLLIQTSVLAASLDIQPRGWGTSMVGLARGSVGVSCRTAAGPCPWPPPGL